MNSMITTDYLSRLWPFLFTGKKNKFVTSAVLGVIITSMMVFCMKTSYFMLLFYVMLGVALFFIAQRWSMLIYLYTCIPRVYVSPVFNHYIYFLDYDNNDGLNPIKAHPLTLMLFSALLIELCVILVKSKFKISKISMLALSVITVFSMVSFAVRGMNGFPILLSNYYAPLLLFVVLFERRSEFNIAQFKYFSRTFISIGIIASIVGFIEFFSKHYIFESVLLNSSWFEGFLDRMNVEGMRVSSFIGHPLDVAGLCVLCILLSSLAFKSVALRLGNGILFSCFALASGSRSYFVTCIISVIIVCIIGQDIKKVIPAIIALSIFSSVLIVSPLGSTILNRFTSENYDNESRFVFFEYFTSNFNLLQKPLGIGGSGDVEIYNQLSQKIILENPWMIIWMELGAVSLIYMAFIIMLLRNTRWNIMLIIMLVTTFFDNSFAVRGKTNTAILMMATICSILASRKREDSYLPELQEE